MVDGPPIASEQLPKQILKLHFRRNVPTTYYQHIERTGTTASEIYPPKAAGSVGGVGGGGGGNLLRRVAGPLTPLRCSSRSAAPRK